jgi:hypothetical protein
VGRGSVEIGNQIPPAVPKDLAKRLGSQGIRRLLALLTNAYQDLYDRKWVKADSPEDSITEEWFIHIQKRWKSDSACEVIPVPQKADTHKAKSRGRPPTIDFCFRDEFFPGSYFGTECKLLDEGCKEHLNAYLDDREGIGRFINGNYAACTGAGAMVGYVRRGDSNVVARDVAHGMKQLDGTPELKKSDPLAEFEQIYESEHLRSTGVSPFLCYHILFAFNC